MKKLGQPCLPVGVRRSTKTWSPISRVFSMELEGISNCWITKPRMKSPPTNTAANPAMVSGSVSFSLCFLSSFLVVSISTLVGKVLSSMLFVQQSMINAQSPKAQSSTHPSKHPAPAGLIKEMNHYMQQEAGTLRPCALRLVGWRDERPVNK